MSNIIPADFAVAWLANRASLLETASGITAVAGDVDLEIAGKCQSDINKAINRLETERKAVTRPLDEAKKEIMDKEKALVAPLEKELKRIKKLTTAYATKVARRVEEERREREKIEALAAEAELAAEQAKESDPFGFNGDAAPAPVIPVPVQTTVMPHTSSNRFVEKWDFTVVDERAVPRELLSVDEKKVRALLNAKKAEGYKHDQIAIPGIKISATMQVYSR